MVSRIQNCQAQTPTLDKNASRVEHVEAASRGRPALDELVSMVEAGTEMEVRMERLGLLAGHLAAARAWLEEAAVALVARQDTADEAVEAGIVMTAEGRSPGVKVEHTEEQVDEAVAAEPVDAPLSAPARKGSGRSRRRGSLRPEDKGDGVTDDLPARQAASRWPSVAALEDLLVRYRDALVVDLSEARELAARVDQARSWLEAAGPLLESGTADEAALRDIVSRGRGIPVALEEFTSLEQRLQSLEWDAEARAIALRLRQSIGDASLASATGTAGTRDVAAGVSLDEGAALLERAARLPGTDAALREWLASCVDAGIAWRQVAQRVLSARQREASPPGDAEAKAGASAATQAEALKDAAPSAVDVSDLEALVQQGATLPFYQEELAQLGAALQAYRDWERRVATLQAESGDPWGW